MGIFDKIKRKIQEIIPGGKTGKEGLETPKPQPTSAPQPGDKLTPTSNLGRGKGEAGTPSFREDELTPSARPPVGSQEVARSASPADVLAGREVADFKRVITQEELDANLTQEDIDNGLSLSSIGSVSPVTTSDILSVSGVGGLAKAAVKGATGLIARGSTKAITSAAENIAGFGKGAAARSRTVSEMWKTEGIDFGRKTATRIPTNVKTAAQTKKLLTESGEKVGMSTIRAVTTASLIIGAIGTYPWAGHLKLDNVIGGLSIAIRDANEAGDIEGAEEAQQKLDDVLNPSLWTEIIGLIPYANVLQEVKRGMGAAQTYAAIQSKITEDIKIKQETGQSDNDYWDNRRKEQAEQDRAAVDYYNEQRKLMVKWEREAADDKRDSDAKFWRKEREKQMQAEAEDRQAIADFWEQYKLEMQKMQANSRPSQLNFGGLF